MCLAWRPAWTAKRTRCFSPAWVAGRGRSISAYGDRRKDDPTASYYGDPLAPGQYQRDRSLLTQLQYQDSFRDDTLQLSGRLFLGRSRYTGLFNYSGVPNLATGSGDWQGVEMRLLSTAWMGHKLMLGME